MENPIKMDDLGVPLFLETPNLNHREPKYFDPTISQYLGTSAPHQWSHTVDQRDQYPSLFDLDSVTIVVRKAAGPRMPKSVEFQKASHTEAEKSDLFISLTMGIPAQGHRHKGVLLLSYNMATFQTHSTSMLKVVLNGTTRCTCSKQTDLKEPCVRCARLCRALAIGAATKSNGDVTRCFHIIPNILWSTSS